jgi:hypothetical protein
VPVAIDLGDDPEVAAARADRALAGDEQLLAAVLLLRHVVVVAGDHLAPAAALLAEPPRHHVLRERHHDGTVAARVLLRPEQVVAVGVHLGGAGDEHREVAVRKILVVGELAGGLDVVLG